MKMRGKKAWSLPTTEVQKFAANEYVAACTVKFVCDVPVSGDLFTADGVNLTPDANGSRWLYQPCGTELDLDVNSDFQTGYVVDNGGNDQKKVWTGAAYKQTPCIIWIGEGANELHATASTDMSAWERNHS